jgi:hypothetical protein
LTGPSGPLEGAGNGDVVGGGGGVREGGGQGDLGVERGGMERVGGFTDVKAKFISSAWFCMCEPRCS